MLLLKFLTSAFLLSVFISAQCAPLDSRFHPYIDLDFSRGDRLDTEHWSRITGVQPKNEVFYTPGDENLMYAPDGLVIQARKEHRQNPTYNHPKDRWTHDIPSREISSANIVSKDYFEYGYFEVVAQTPEIAGVHPAIWLQGKNHGEYGEIDIMESIGAKRPATKFATIHAGPSVHQLTKQTAHRRIGNGFHKYAASWTPEKIVISYDDQEVLTIATNFGSFDGVSPLKQPMQLRINLSLGGSWSGPIDLAKLPVSMEIKSIKIWKYEP